MLTLLHIYYCDIDSNAELWHKIQESEFRNPSWGIYCEIFTAIQTCITKISLRREVHTALVTTIFVNYLLSVQRCGLNRRSEYKFSVWNCSTQNCRYSFHHQNMDESFALSASMENELISFNARVWMRFTHLHSTYGNNMTKIEISFTLTHQG